MAIMSITIYAQKAAKSKTSSSGGPSNGMIPNLNGGPNDPLCISGAGHCEGGVVIVGCQQLREAISKKNLNVFFNTQTIKIWSGGNVTLKKYLELVKEGKLFIKEENMPKFKGKRVAFIIGDKDLSRTKFTTAIVVQESQ